MTHTKNGVPIYAEEQIINEEKSSIQEILNQFKQPVSDDKYIKLKLEEGNYMGSTNPKWKDKPNYERYGFYLEEEEEKWVQIDIPCNLIEKLEIEKGDDITYPIYLTIDISQKKLIRGAYTIDNEKEVFIDKPVSEKNVEKELVKRLKELEELREKVKEFKNLKDEKAKLEEKSRNLEEVIQEKDKENERLDGLVQEGIKLKKELEEMKRKKRDWKSFYYWVMNNIIDENVYVQIIDKNNQNSSPWLDNEHKSAFRKNRQKGFSNLSFMNSFLLFLNNLEASVKNIEPRFLGRNDGYREYFEFLEYDDNKDLTELVPLLSYLYKSGGWGRFKEEFDKIFSEWREANPPQTTAQ